MDLSVLLAPEPNSKSSISESSESKSENFFFSFRLVRLAAIAAGFSGKPVTEGTADGGVATGLEVETFGVVAGAEVGVEKKLSSSLVEAAAASATR